MAHPYFPHTDSDIAAMLERCGVSSMDDLYSDVPDELLLKRPYDIAEGKCETDVRRYFDALGRKNRTLICFAGAGYYDHAVPSVIPNLLARSEFLTAYTPYQPEISQGTLHAIFEYQSVMSELTGLPVCNASMYDGATATAEAMMMTVAAARKRNRVLVSATLLPAVVDVVKTYAHYHGVTLDIIPESDGVTSIDDLKAMLIQGDVAGVILPQPNRYGIIEDLTGVAEAIHEAKALMVMNCQALSLAVLRSPAEWGADIAVGEAQSLGMPLSYGGPYLGYMCSTKALMRKMPGRIVGATKDDMGQRVFVLTLQAREQHIRRDKATSNICSNQGLMALYATMYASLLGPKGLREVCETSHAGAEYLVEQLTSTGRMKATFAGRPFFNEFVVTTALDIPALQRKCADDGILCGVQIAPDRLMFAVTEMQTREDMDRLVEIVKSF